MSPKGVKYDDGGDGQGMSFVQRLKDKVQKENLWFFILLLLAKKPRYGYELRKLVKQEFGFWSGTVTAYRVLYSLEAEGMVKSRIEERRRYYEITERGRSEMEEAKRFLAQLLE
jgi:PadR family transcriptional regulator, regulatory protein PadR